MCDALDLYCADQQRKSLILDHPDLNGIDYIEYDEFPALPPALRYRLSVTFLKPPPAGLTGADVRISGGVRIVGIRALPGPLVAAPVPANPPATLFVQLDGAGDFSEYTLRIAHQNLDMALDHADFSFRAGCPSELDCRPALDCAEIPLEEPQLDYLAKDFASFRRLLLLDFARTRNPSWNEGAVADLGTTLVELFAYQGDLLSWSQDAVATEAFLETCRLRVSVRRHSRLIDHRMHDGRNAYGFVVLDAGSGGVVPIGTRFLTRITRPLRGDTAAPGPLIVPRPDSAFDEDPALRDALVFEATARTRIDPALNLMFFHTRGDTDCCLPQGATGAALFSVDATRTAYAPTLAVGDWLLLEETKSVATGAPADADPANRRAVRLVSVQSGLTDPAFQAAVAGSATNPVLRPIGPADAALPRLPLIVVAWDAERALDISLCLSARTARGDAITNISNARGNVVPVDHGRTINAALDDIPAELPGFARAARLRLPDAPLIFAAPGLPGPVDALGRPIAGRHALAVNARSVLPSVSLRLTLPGAPPVRWDAVPDLLDSGPFEEHFRVEIDDQGAATLLFGDGEHGRGAQGATAIVTTYRIGNGVSGNVGRDAIAHMLVPEPAAFIDPADPATPPGAPPALQGIRQPIAATGGVDPETIAEVRALAAAAMRAIQFRAVTETDWQARALAIPGVADAKATFRWTGSWYAVFVALHPADPAALITLPGGRTELGDNFSTGARAAVTRVRLAGYDLELNTAVYVPLELRITVCLARGHFRGAVLRAVGEALSNRRFADGRIGFFQPTMLRFGAPVRLSVIIAAAQAIAGVDSLDITMLRRYWMLPNGELDSGVLPLGPFEIARLDNDPNFPENGVLALHAVGGL